MDQVHSNTSSCAAMLQLPFTLTCTIRKISQFQCYSYRSYLSKVDSIGRCLAFHWYFHCLIFSQYLQMLQTFSYQQLILWCNLADIFLSTSSLFKIVTLRFMKLYPSFWLVCSIQTLDDLKFKIPFIMRSFRAFIQVFSMYIFLWRRFVFPLRCSFRIQHLSYSLVVFGCLICLCGSHVVVVKCQGTYMCRRCFHSTTLSVNLSANKNYELEI